MRHVTRAMLAGAPAIRVYRLALQCSAAAVGARFGSVFVKDDRASGGDDLLKLACAYNWPQSAAKFLSVFRVRVGLGGTGSAVGNGSPVEVDDLFSDPALDDWWEPARELGFSALASFPLTGRAGGAVTYYFDAPHRLGSREREVLSMFVDLVALAADRERMEVELKLARPRPGRQMGARQQPLRPEPTDDED